MSLENQRFCCLDVETVPDDALPEDCVPRFTKVFDPAEVKTGDIGRLTKISEEEKEARRKAKIDAAAQAFELERKAFEVDIIKKCSIDPDLCRVACIVCMEFGMEEGDEQMIFGLHSAAGGEGTILTDTWAWLQYANDIGMRIVTFAGTHFDFPVLQRRAMIHRVPVWGTLFRTLTARHYSNHIHLDLQEILLNGDRSRMRDRNLDFFLRRFELGSKGGKDGSQVYAMWQEERFDDIVTYCRDTDVMQTIQLFRRISPWIL